MTGFCVLVDKAVALIVEDICKTKRKHDIKAFQSIFLDNCSQYRRNVTICILEVFTSLDRGINIEI